MPVILLSTGQVFSAIILHCWQVLNRLAEAAQHRLAGQAARCVHPIQG